MDVVNARILVVDPSRIMQSIYTKLLVNLGIVSPAYSVEEAFELLDADSVL
jgi:CheY-like chemotaxis protein